jgi:hypothetical protein
VPVTVDGCLRFRTPDEVELLGACSVDDDVALDERSRSEGTVSACR